MAGAKIFLGVAKAMSRCVRDDESRSNRTRRLPAPVLEADWTGDRPETFVSGTLTGSCMVNHCQTASPPQTRNNMARAAYFFRLPVMGSNFMDCLGYSAPSNRKQS